jgi:hypothetical protein
VSRYTLKIYPDDRNKQKTSFELLRLLIHVTNIIFSFLQTVNRNLLHNTKVVAYYYNLNVSIRTYILQKHIMYYI